MTRKESFPPYLAELNQKQREAVLHTGSPLLILAGAGSGKTRVITTKIAYALDVLTTDPRSILAVTFTNKAAAEMRERLTALTEAGENVMIKTFHSFGAWILRLYGKASGIDPRFLIYDENDSLALLKSDLKKTHSLDEIRRFLSSISRAKDLCLTPEEPLDRITADPEFPSIYAGYDAHLKRTGNLDFGDLIMRTVLLLRSTENVRISLHNRFTMILVDEYQDSNRAQYKLLKVLASPSSYLCVVGDDDQSIYGFRGAEVENIVGFPDSFAHTTIIRLEENYRSTKTILAAAGSVVSRNQKRLGKTMITRNEQGEPIVLARFANHTEEALYVARLIEEDPLTETAVLYRMNYQSRVFEEIFTKRRIPFLLVGSLRFYERGEVKDILAYLSFIVNPRDEVALRRIINKPARAIGEKTQLVLFGDGSGLAENPAELLHERRSLLSARAAGAVQDFFKMIVDLRSLLAASTLTHFVNELVMRTGIYDYYREKDDIDGTAKLHNIEELVNAAAAYGTGADAVIEFLENTTLVNPEYDDRFSRQTMLITVHNTKGLEFERVIMTGCEEGVFPPAKREDEQDAIEEERRLFYVGLTRARRSLVLTTCRSRLLFGTTISSTPSRFLSEIPDTLLSLEDYTPSRQEAATDFPRGTRVYSDDYGPGYVIKADVVDGNEVLTVRFENGRDIRILPKYHDLVRIRED